MLRTYASAFEGDDAARGESIADALGAPGCALPLARRAAGETIAYSSDGASYTTLMRASGQAPSAATGIRRWTLAGRALVVRESKRGLRYAAAGWTAAAVESGARRASPASTARRSVLEIALEGANPSAQSFVLLPAIDTRGDALWRGISSGEGFRYSDREGERGTIARVVLRRSPSGKLLLRVSAYGANGALALVPPDPGSAAFLTLRIPGGDRYCVRYGSEGQTRNDGAKLFRLSNPSVVACPP